MGGQPRHPGAGDHAPVTRPSRAADEQAPADPVLPAPSPTKPTLHPHLIAPPRECACPWCRAVAVGLVRVRTDSEGAYVQGPEWLFSKPPAEGARLILAELAERESLRAEQELLDLCAREGDGSRPPKSQAKRRRRRRDRREARPAAGEHGCSTQGASEEPQGRGVPPWDPLLVSLRREAAERRSDRVGSDAAASTPRDHAPRAPGEPWVDGMEPPALAGAAPPDGSDTDQVRPGARHADAPPPLPPHGSRRARRSPMKFWRSRDASVCTTW